MFSLIANECRKFHLKLTKPGSVPNFNNALNKLLTERKKAENVFLDEVE